MCNENEHHYIAITTETKSTTVADTTTNKHSYVLSCVNCGYSKLLAA